MSFKGSFEGSSTGVKASGAGFLVNQKTLGKPDVQLQTLIQGGVGFRV